MKRTISVLFLPAEQDTPGLDFALKIQSIYYCQIIRITKDELQELVTEATKLNELFNSLAR